MQGWERHRRIAIASVAAVIGGLLAFAEPAAAAGTLTNVQLTVSNNQTSATNVVYSQSLTVATTGAIKYIAFSVPAGTTGTPTVAANYGIGAGSVVLASDTVTYSVTTPVSVSAGTPILLEIGGLTNTGTAGSYASTVSTSDVSPTVIDQASNNNVDIADSGTQVSVVIAKSLLFTNDTSSFTLLMDPSLPALSDLSKTVNLSVKTNASQGYSLAVNDTAQGLAVGANQIPRFSANGQAGAALWNSSVDKFGYSLSVTGATAPAGMSGGQFAGYSATPETVASRTSPTGNTPNTIAITNRVAIDFAQAAGTYGDTITYTVTPNY